MGFEMGSRDGLWNDATAELWQWDPALQTWDRAYLFGGCPYRGGGERDVHGEEERGKRIYVAVTCTRMQMLSRGFQIPVYLLRNSGSVMLGR